MVFSEMTVRCLRGKMESWYDGSFDLHGVGVRGVDTRSLAHIGLTRDHSGS